MVKYLITILRESIPSWSHLKYCKGVISIPFMRMETLCFALNYVGVFFYLLAGMPVLVIQKQVRSGNYPTSAINIEVYM